MHIYKKCDLGNRTRVQDAFSYEFTTIITVAIFHNVDNTF